MELKSPSAPQSKHIGSSRTLLCLMLFALDEAIQMIQSRHTTFDAVELYKIPSIFFPNAAVAKNLHDKNCTQNSAGRIFRFWRVRRGRAPYAGTTV